MGEATGLELRMRPTRYGLDCASRLKVLVETLLIAPQGEKPVMMNRVDQLQELNGGNTDMVAHPGNGLSSPDQILVATFL